MHDTMKPDGHDWSCQETEARLGDYLDGTLSSAAREQFESHAASCVGCASLIASITGLVSSLRQLEPVVEPPNLPARILAATLGPQRAKSGWRSWLRWLRPVSQPRFAYGAVSVLVTVAVVSQAMGFEWRESAIASLNPVNIVHAANRQAHQAYAHSVKFLDNLRLVYEIQTRLHPDDETEQIAAPPTGSPEKNSVPGENTVPHLINRMERNDPARHQALFEIHSRPGRST
jgi:hypothetical protein